MKKSFYDHLVASQQIGVDGGVRYYPPTFQTPVAPEDDRIDRAWVDLVANQLPDSVLARVS